MGGGRGVRREAVRSGHSGAILGEGSTFHGHRSQVRHRRRDQGCGGRGHQAGIVLVLVAHNHRRRNPSDHRVRRRIAMAVVVAWLAWPVVLGRVFRGTVPVMKREVWPCRPGPRRGVRGLGRHCAGRMVDLEADRDGGDRAPAASGARASAPARTVCAGNRESGRWSWWAACSSRGAQGLVLTMLGG